MIKILNKVGIGENVLNTIKNIYEKPTDHIRLNGERQIRNKARMPVFMTSIQPSTGSSR